MYTEGYVKKIKCHARKLVLEPAPPYSFKSDGMTYALEMKEGPLAGQSSMKANVIKPEELELAFRCWHLSALVTLKTTRSRIGVSYGEDKKITELIVL